MDDPGGDVPANLSDDVTDTGVFQTVLDGYDAVYEALPQSKVFSDIWRANAYRGQFPGEFAHIGFLTLDEGRRLVELLRLSYGRVLVDVACGTGGPGLWVAQQTGVTLIGVDPAAPGLTAATRRAERVGLADRATFQQGTFEQTGLADGAADAVMTIEAFQYAPAKRAALAEFHRILRPGGRVAIVCFEVDPAKVEGLPVLGVDPIPDYAPLLEGAGFVIDAYEETPGWEPRVYGTFGALVDAADALVADIGERAAAGARRSHAHRPDEAVSPPRPRHRSPRRLMWNGLVKRVRGCVAGWCWGAPNWRFGAWMLLSRRRAPGVKVERPHCATRRPVVSPAQPGGTRREVPGLDD